MSRLKLNDRRLVSALALSALGSLLVACQPEVQGPSPYVPSIRRDAGLPVDDAAVVDAGDPIDAAGGDSATVDVAAADVVAADTVAADGAVADVVLVDGATADAVDTDADCPGCAGPEDTSTRCSDHVSNDGDTYIDCRDHDCALVWPCNVPESTTEACSDGHDNDGDGYLDCVDFNCDLVWPCNVPETTAAACLDGHDNDGDGQRDCADPNCAVMPVCLPYENTALTCTDGVDNDDDSDQDCADAECLTLSVCGTVEDGEASCSDLVDNDGDLQLDCRDPGCSATAVCSVALARVATWNVELISAPGSVGHSAALAVIQRIAPDVLCLQEVEDLESSSLQALAQAAGLPHVFQGYNSTAMSGGLTVACLSRWAYDEAASRSSDDISSDPGANETGRDIVQLRVAVRPGSLYLGVFSVHLKAGFTDLDRFRRHIEALRLAQVVAAYRAAHPTDPVVVMGDFNEAVDDSSLGVQWSAAPVGLPISYQLGSDVTFPQAYSPFAGLEQAGFAYTEPTLEDRTDVEATRFDSTRRIDYLLFLGARLLGDELYDDCEDNGVDDSPLGNWLPKAGSPLTCGTEQSASDHRLVYADLDVEP